ncbi:class I SAM-dependent methyltransferase [Saccharicrinis sp. 156]|uniref:class I SAM-dependent methyltransferase n=1 Tax=Saccharicrinis sp. 156 TaxID=3417574 RepID=UPI003D356F8D
MNYLKINQDLWDRKTDIHFDSDFYNVKAFKQGKDSLNQVELELLGDVRGKRMLHLQCHFGMDTISLARHGAMVTGIDLSGKAISRAKQLNGELGMSARFIQSDVYQLPEMLDQEFDIVFTSYGTIGWLPDMEKWAQVISRFLKPRGRFVMVEFHPVVWMFSYDFKKVEFDYLNTGPIVEVQEGTYADTNADIKGKSVCWNHGLGEVQNALIKSGLEITDVQEYDYSPYDCFQNTVEIETGKFQIEGLQGKLPMLFSLVAQKK